ncbi:calcium-binding protein [uncultured Jannaschia sp.]|uniref:calcium-binding protein n=1 Tax=uncultured Jannaschia sp. TaxID=293347 RepID=UPI0026038581|nr:calcium-binding protein [uncultured Jannaschia sp.]
MSAVFWNHSIGTMQTDYSFSSPEFLLKSEESHPLGTFQWVVAETGRSNSVLMPGETVALVAVDSLGYYSQDNVTEARYLGVVDITGDGFIDGLVLESRFDEVVLTDLRPYLHFTPFSDHVTMSRQSYTIDSGSVTLPDDLLDTPTAPGDDARPTRSDDVLLGTAGQDRIDALGGDDLVGSGRSDDTIWGRAGDDTLSGDAGNDRLLGNGGADWLFGGSGSDLMKDGGGGDSLLLGGGRDTAFGGGGRDSIEGGGGADELHGNRGSDVLTGGKGVDTFVFARGDGSDTITDFAPAFDMIEIGRGASRFSQLEIADERGGAVISFANVEIHVRGIGADRLDDPDLFSF